MRNCKALLFARVGYIESNSSVDESLETQLLALRAYAIEHGLTVAEEIRNSGVASSQSLSEITSYLRNHPEVRTVVTKCSDRLARDLSKFVLIEALVEDLDIEIHFLEQPQILRKKPNSPDRFIQRIFTLFDNKYIEQLREQVAKGQTRRAESGQFPGRPPYGYTTEHKTIVKHPVNANIVQHIYERIGSGQITLRGLRRELNRMTGTRMSLSKLLKILTSCFYLGEFVWRGRKYSGNHPRLVDVDTYERVQRMLANNTGNQHGKGKRTEP